MWIPVPPVPKLADSRNPGDGGTKPVQNCVTGDTCAGRFRGLAGTVRGWCRPLREVRTGRLRVEREKILGKGSPRYGRLHHLALFRAGRPTEQGRPIREETKGGTVSVGACRTGAALLHSREEYRIYKEFSVASLTKNLSKKWHLKTWMSLCAFCLVMLWRLATTSKESAPAMNSR